ncbi:AEC family transporter [soil metagenome]
MSAVIDAVLPIFALIFVGAMAARKGVLGPEAMNALTVFVLKLGLPAVLFLSMAKITGSQLANLRFLGSFGGGLLITFAVSFALDRNSRHRLTDASIESLAASYPNTAFIGIPLCLVALGPESVPAAAIASVMIVFPLMASAIVMIELDQHPNANRAASIWRVGTALVRNPLILGSGLGLLWAATGFNLPGPVERSASLLGSAASPCALIAIGMFLAQQRASSDTVAVGRVVGLKLFVQPAVTTVLALFLFPVTTIWMHAAILLSALPIGTGPVMLAQLYGREAGVTSRAILFSTIGSIATISLLLTWFQH